MAVSTSTLQAIKASPISAIIAGSGGKLKKVGHEFLTQCLWHDDTNPSLTISDEKGFCYCHVCGSSGDAIHYLRRRHGLGMFEAAQMAAQIAEVPFETDDIDPEEAARKAAARKAAITKLEKEQAIYKSNLRDQKAERIRNILRERGITPTASKEFGIGFSNQGFFAGRITLPIYNHRNELVGWTGRATKEDQTAKYKNSADSELFQKKQLVFNEYRAKEAAREAGSLIFVEGHLDVVSMWQAGIRNVVAMQGTGAPDQSILKRLACNIKNFILCFDGDAGGRKATEHFISTAGPLAMAGEININVAVLPEKKDPDEIIREKGNIYSYIVTAEPWLDWVIGTWAAALDKDNTAMVTEVEQKLRALIDRLRSKALRTHYIDKAARVLSKNEKEAEKLAKEWGNTEFIYSSAQWKPRSAADARLAAERRLMRLFIHCPHLRKELSPLLDHVTNPALKWLQKRLEELQAHSATDLTPYSIMSIVAVSEPHFMQQLRTLIKPKVDVDERPGVKAHLKRILTDKILVE